jgi:hypothetical protein
MWIKKTEKCQDTLNTEKADGSLGSSSIFWGEKASFPLYMNLLPNKHLRRRLPPGRRQLAYSKDQMR